MANASRDWGFVIERDLVETAIVFVAVVLFCLSLKALNVSRLFMQFLRNSRHGWTF